MRRDCVVGVDVGIRGIVADARVEGQTISKGISTLSAPTIGQVECRGVVWCNRVVGVDVLENIVWVRLWWVPGLKGSLDWKLTVLRARARESRGAKDWPGR